MDHPENSRPAPYDRFRPVALAVITVAFAISRLAMLSAGVLIQERPDFIQLLDFPLLSSHLLQSIYYLHSEPPLVNLLLGIGLKLFPHNYPLFFAVIFWLLGFFLPIALYSLMVGVGVRWWISLILTVLFEISPATLLFENLYYDTYPTTFLLCFSAYALNRFLNEGSQFHGYAFVVALGLPVFLNASFQITWFLGVAVVLLYFDYDRLRPLVPAGLIMLSLILLLYIKNLIVFGTFTTSSLIGVAVAGNTTQQLSFQDRSGLVLKGELSPYAIMSPFPILSGPKTARTDIPVLDEVSKGDLRINPNVNNLNYLTISRADLHDAIWVVRHRPLVYPHGVWRAIKNYFQPASADLLYLQRYKIPRWSNLFEILLEPSWLPALPVDPLMDTMVRSRPAIEPPSTILLIGIPILGLFAIATVLSEWRDVDAYHVTMLFITLTILYSTALATLLTFGECNRYRYEVDPLYIVLFGILVMKVGGFVRRWFNLY